MEALVPIQPLIRFYNFLKKQVPTCPPLSSSALTRSSTLTAEHQSKITFIYSNHAFRGHHRKSHCLFSSPKACSHAPLLTAATAEDHEDGGSIDIGTEENTTHQVKVKGSGLRWSDVDVRSVDAAQRKLIEELPPKISGRSKALIKHIICMTEEDDPCPLVSKWVKVMKPKRVDWLAVLKQINAYNHPLFFKITEIALDEESFEPSIRDYTKLINGYAREDHLEDAERILWTMGERGFICDAITYTVLIRMYSKAGKLDHAIHTFDKMRLFGLQLDQKAYGAMIMAYVRAGMPEAGEYLVREMEAKDIKAGTEVYKALLKSFALQGNAVGAQRVFNSMQFAGIAPNLNSCTVLVEAYVHAGELDQARIAFENMRKAGHNPDDKCTSIMVYAYQKKNLIGKALTLLFDLEKDGFKPGIETSALLIDWLGKLGFVEEAEQVFLELTEITEAPLKVLVSLCDMYARAGLHEKVVNTLTALQNNCQALDVNEFERLICGLLAGGFVDQARKMHEQMQIKGLTPSESISLALLDVKSA